MRLLKITLLFIVLLFFNACQEGDYRISETKNPEILTSENIETKAPIMENKGDSTDVETSEISQTNKFIKNKKVLENTDEQNLSKNQQSNKANQENLDKPRSWWQIGAIVSIILNIILLLLLLKTRNSLKYQKSRKDIYKKEISVLNNRSNDFIGEKNSLIRKNNDLVEKLNSTKEKNNVSPKQYSDDVKSEEIIFNNINSNPTPPPPVNKPKFILYAGKPSDANTLSAVSSQQDEHRSIFKLILENKEAESAKFEVVENGYILKMIANSPDTYLYSVCNPENSNQNFDSSILTTKKGTAYLTDGEWRVNDEDKATIKFQ